MRTVPRGSLHTEDGLIFPEISSLSNHRRDDDIKGKEAANGTG
jgi:hypothetical protein